MLVILQTLFPVFGLIAIGVFLRRIGFLDAGMEKSLNRFCYFVALPVFLFWKSAASEAFDLTAIRLPGAFLLVTAGLLILGWGMAALGGLNPRSRGTFIQASFRGNLAYIGLPVLAHALSGQPQAVADRAAYLAILCMAPTILIYNVLGVMVLEWDRRHEHHLSPLKAFGSSTLKNPLIIACALGFGWNALSLPMPPSARQLAEPIGRTAFPLALMAIGARIAVLEWRNGLRNGLMLCLVKNVAGLLLAVAVARILHIGGTSRLVLYILSVCPTAVASYVLVDQLNGDRELAASSIALSTFISLFALAGALWMGL